MRNLINYNLLTKDGRRIGNALVVGHDFGHLQIITDYGNSVIMKEEDIDKYFYIGTEQNDSHKYFKNQ